MVRIRPILAQEHPPRGGFVLSEPPAAGEVGDTVAGADIPTKSSGHRVSPTSSPGAAPRRARAERHSA